MRGQAMGTERRRTCKSQQSSKPDYSCREDPYLAGSPECWCDNCLAKAAAEQLARWWEGVWRSGI